MKSSSNGTSPCKSKVESDVVDSKPAGVLSVSDLPIKKIIMFLIS